MSRLEVVGRSPGCEQKRGFMVCAHEAWIFATEIEGSPPSMSSDVSLYSLTEGSESLRRHSKAQCLVATDNAK